VFGITVKVTPLTPKHVVAEIGNGVIVKVGAVLITITKLVVTCGQPPEAVIVFDIV
jgi:hypothetical protein